MSIEYKTGRYFKASELEELFSSVSWGSAKYPELLAEAMKNYETVVTAWEGRKLLGLICVMSDGCMNAYVPYLLVRPDYQKKGIGRRLVEIVKRRYSSYKTLTLVSLDTARDFYRKCGFQDFTGTSALHISSIQE